MFARVFSFGQKRGWRNEREITERNGSQIDFRRTVFSCSDSQVLETSEFLRNEYLIAISLSFGTFVALKVFSVRNILSFEILNIS